MVMAGMKQSKRVSWAPAVNLCQVRLFLSEDAPYQSGLAAQENLQAKASYLLHATGTGTDDSLPPGFEDPDATHQLKTESSQIPVVKWKCPHKILLNPEWRVVAGEESEEIPLQNYRQLRVLEAIYPRQSNIPPNPSDSTEIQDSIYDDSKTPLIPIMAIEDEDSPEQLTTTPVTGLSQCYQPGIPSIPMDVVTGSVSTKEQSQPPAAQAYLPLPPETASSGYSLIAEPDVMAAASAAFTAIMSSNEEGSMIDKDLLINILKDPTLLKLVSEHGGAPLQAAQQTPPAIVPSLAPSIPQPSFSQVHHQTNISSHPRFSDIRPSQAYPMTGVVPPLALASHAVSVNIPAKTVNDTSSLKDINYYKSLIQQHGGENPGGIDIPLSMGNYPRNFATVNPVIFSSKQQRDGKLQRIPKPCIYFNSPRGCRRGESCLYQHDTLLDQQSEQRNGPKRIKLDRGMANRN